MTATNELIALGMPFGVAARIVQAVDAAEDAAKLSTWQILAASAVAVSHTGDTDETTLATVTVPGGAMGANGILRVTAAYSFTGVAGTKRGKIRFGGAGGDLYVHATTTSSDHVIIQRTIWNRNSESSQIGSTQAASTNSYAVQSGSMASGTQDTSTDTDLLLRCQLDDAGDAIKLESYLIELFYQA